MPERTSSSRALGSALLLAIVRGDRLAFHATDHLVTATNPDDGGSRTMSAEPLVGHPPLRTPADDGNAAWAPGFSIFDLDAGTAPRTDGAIALSASAMLSNVLDRRYDTSIVPNAARGRFFEPGPGRTLTVAVEVSRARGAR